MDTPPTLESILSQVKDKVFIFSNLYFESDTVALNGVLKGYSVKEIKKTSVNSCFEVGLCEVLVSSQCLNCSKRHSERALFRKSKMYLDGELN